MFNLKNNIFNTILKCLNIYYKKTFFLNGFCYEFKELCAIPGQHLAQI